VSPTKKFMMSNLNIILFEAVMVIGLGSSKRHPQVVGIHRLVMKNGSDNF